MRATDSTRMAMRWWWCDAVLLVLIISCAPMVRRWYVPQSGERTLGMDELREAADLALRDECPRLLRGGTSATGEVLVVVDVEPGGAVRRARIERSSGDRAVDDLFGTLATRMRLDRLSTTAGESAEGEVEMGYSCAPNVAIATIRLNP
jgi:TonB family protein